MGDIVVKESIQTKIVQVVKDRFDIKIDREVVDSRSKVADLSSVVAMMVCKQVGKTPVEVAREIVDGLGGISGVKNIVAEDNGYINFYLSDDSHKEVVSEYVDGFGKLDIGSGKQMMVEFGQPNTHKALQLGHFKSAITGLSIARLYENLGYEVVKANYFGDIGLQVANCLWGVINRNGTWYEKFGKEDLKEIKENLDSIVREKGIDAAALYLDQSYVLGRNQSTNKEEILAQVKDINMKIYERSDDNILALYDYTREISIKHQDKAFKELGVEYDVQYPESKVWELGKQTVLDNVGKVFVEDDGAIIFDGEKYGLQKWVYLTSAGFPSYSGKDLGLAITKFKEYPKLDFAIVTTSVEQNAYFRALIKSLELIDPSFEGKYMHVGFGWLLFENKKMNSKSGKNVKYTDLIAEALEIARSNISDEKGYSDSEREEIARVVAMGALKFAILSHEFHKDINWDINKFMSMNGFAAPYILYTYARGRSVMRNCEYIFKDGDDSLEYDALYNSDIELDLLRKIGEYKDIVKVAGSNLSPHLLCRYLYELSEIFNRFYGEFNVQNEEDSNIKKGRLRLIYVTTEVIKKGLYLLGIDTVEQM